MLLAAGQAWGTGVWGAGSVGSLWARRDAARPAGGRCPAAAARARSAAPPATPTAPATATPRPTPTTHLVITLISFEINIPPMFTNK